MLRSKLMIGVAVLVLLGASAGCAVDLEQPPEAASTLERTVEETIVVSEQPAEEASVDLEQPAGETDGFTIQGWVTVDAYHYDAATGTYIHFYHHESSNLLTTIGLDWIAQQLGGAPSGDPAKWIALSLSTDALNAAWTQIPAEIAAGGLERAAGDYVHTASTNEWTIANTFTASAAHIAVQLTGLQWNSVGESNNNLLAANTFDPVTLAINDSLAITWTLTLS